MRIIRVVVLLTTLMSAASAWGQVLWGTSPRTWLAHSPPTVRSWGMGFTGVAVPSSRYIPLNPAGLGLWAMSPSVIFGQNYERTPADRSTPTTYDVSSWYGASGVHWSADAVRGDVRFGLGILYTETRSRWGPALHATGWEEEVLLIEDGRTREWEVGIALRYGFELGLGYGHRETSTSWTVPDPKEGQDEFGPRSESPNQETNVGLMARVPVFHTLALMGTGDTLLKLGPVGIELTGALGTYPANNNYRSGVSLLAQVCYETLPLLTVEGNRDSEDGRYFRGFELSIGGFYSYRAGDWNYLSYIGGTDGSSFTRLWRRWPTRGHAIHSAGLTRWIARWVGAPFSRGLERAADHVDLFYERAWFPDSWNRPSGFGEIRAVEWGISLTNLNRLW